MTSTTNRQARTMTTSNLADRNRSSHSTGENTMKRARTFTMSLALAAAILTILMAGVGTAQVQQMPPQRQQQQVVYRDGNGRYWLHDGRNWHLHTAWGWQVCGQHGSVQAIPICSPSGSLTPVQTSISSTRYVKDAHGNTWYFNGSSWLLWTRDGWRNWAPTGLQPPLPPGLR